MRSPRGSREHSEAGLEAGVRVHFWAGMRTHFWGRNPDPFLGPDSCPPILIHTNSQKGGSIFGAGFRPQKRGRLFALSGPKTGPLAHYFARRWRRAHGRIMRRNGPPLGRRSCAWMRPKHPFAFGKETAKAQSS